MRARILSNVTMQPIVGFLRPLDVTCGDDNSLLFELADQESVAAAPGTTHVLCLFDSDVLLGDAVHGVEAPIQAGAFIEALDVFCARNPGTAVVANSFCVGPDRALNFADIIGDASVGSLEASLNARLVGIARSHRNLLLLDVAPLFKRYGFDNLVNSAFWYVGRIRYTNLMFRCLAERLNQALAAFRNQAKKVLVLDLDGTLWGGIVGELGPLGVVLSETGEGRCFRDFQRVLKALASTGVLLAICSKNNPADVDEVFERNPMMVLQRDDFACIRTNWEPKPKNLADIADTLELGLDSLVYLDDNPVEREMVATMLPEVTVPAFPERVDLLPSWLIRDVVNPHFGKYRITSEDAGKTRQYQAKEARNQLALRMDLDSFLADLKIQCRVHVDAPDHIVRASQMTQKTNQFNLTTRRYEVTDVTRFVESSDHAVIVLEYADRFGMEGIVGLAILDLGQGNIDSFLLSCRVISRKVEDRLLDQALELFRERGVRRVTGEFIPTKKNASVASFFDSHGFSLISESGDGSKCYERVMEDLA